MVVGRGGLSKTALRWGLLLALVFALILVPFLLFEAPLAALMGDAVTAARGHGLAAGGVIALVLAGDILLPVPSSLVSSLAGALLGFWGGVLAIWSGMSAGCLLGYWVGRGAGHGLMRRIVGEGEVARARAMLSGAGGIALVATRAVPVLAETLVLGAGAAGMRLAPFLLLTGLANLAVALAYAAIGAWALSEGSFLLLFFGLAAVPMLGWIVWTRVRA